MKKIDHHPGLYLRGQTYWFRVQVRPRFRESFKGKREVKFSLKTRDRQVAESLARQHYAKHETRLLELKRATARRAEQSPVPSPLEMERIARLWFSGYRERHHAVHEIRLNEIAPDVALAGCVRGHGAIRHHHAGRASGREVMDHMLYPGKVCIALGRGAVPPAGIVSQPITAPIGDIERWIGEDEVGLEIRERVVMEASLAVPANGASMPWTAMFILASRQVVRFISWP